MHDEVIPGHRLLQVAEPENVEDGVETDDGEEMFSRKDMGGRVIRFVLIQSDLLYTCICIAIAFILAWLAQTKK